jgi:hypothetical protein
VLLTELERRGILGRLPEGYRVLDRERVSNPGFVRRQRSELAALYEERRTEDKQRLEKMMDYAEMGSCRTAELLRYFGEKARSGCDHCDNCASLAARGSARRGPGPTTGAVTP